MTISGERIEQLNIFCRITGFTSDFLSFIDVELIRFFHGALQLCIASLKHCFRRHGMSVHAKWCRMHDVIYRTNMFPRMPCVVSFQYQTAAVAIAVTGIHFSGLYLTLYNCLDHVRSLHCNEISPSVASPSVASVSVHFLMPELSQQPAEAAPEISATWLKRSTNKDVQTKHGEHKIIR